MIRADRGIVEGLAAYTLWGLAPLFWKQLDDVASIDTLGHRIVWTAVLLAVLHSARRGWPAIRAVAADPRNRLVAALTALLILGNWATYIWAVTDERVVEASLGYFINPLVSVFLGIIVLGERLRRWQWAAVAVAAVGVGWLTIDVGAVPWVALVLAGSFGLYGLLRKTAGFGALDGLTMEVGYLMPLGLGFLIWRAASGDGVMGSSRPSTTVLLILTGAITALPLLLFARAARQVSLTMVGILQYIAPTLQFLIGWLIYDESVDAGRLVGYSIVWLALAIFSIEGLLSARSRRGTSVHSEACPPTSTDAEPATPSSSRDVR